MALAAERGGADFLLAISAGRMRSMGAPSIACMLPIFDAQSLTEGFARQELLAQCRVPVLLGVNLWGAAFDPAGRARAIRDAGFAGAVNFPICMHYSRPMQQLLARAGRGIEQEVEQPRAVKELGLITMFYCATRTQARLAADAGLDLVCLNLGWNVGGALGHRSRATIEELAVMAREIGRLIKRIHPRTRFLLEGGPIATAEDLAMVLGLAAIDGYVGGSTIERMPLESAVADQVGAFRQASRRSAVLEGESTRFAAWGKRFGFIGTSPPQLAFLGRLRTMAALQQNLLLLAERGLNPTPVLKVLSGRGRIRGLLQIDVASEEIPGRVRNILFGRPDSVATRRPALGDEDVCLIAIHAPERLPSATQKRLARAMRDGTFRPPGSRRNLRVVPRVVLVCDLPVSEDRLDE